MRTVLRLAAAHPWPCILGLLLVTLSVLPLLRGLQVNISAQSTMERGTAAWHLLQETKRTFGSDTITVVYLNDPLLFTPGRLALVRDAVAAIEKLPFTAGVSSLFSTRNVKNQDGYISTRPFFDEIPQERAAIERIRDEALRNPLLVDNLLARNGQAMAFNVTFTDHDGSPEIDRVATAAIEKILAPLRQRLENVFQIGAPAIRDTLSKRILHDQNRLLPLSLGVLLLTLALSLRRPSAALIPLASAGLSVIWTLAFMAWLEIPVNILTSIVPALIIVIGSTEDIHLLAEYLAGIRRGLPPAAAREAMAERMGVAILLTFGTTYAGFLSIALNKVELLYQFGLVASTGLLFNFLITVLLVPALLALSGPRPRTRAQPPKRETGTRRLVIGLLHAVQRHKPAVLYLIALSTALSLVGAVRLRVNNNPLDYLEADSPVHRQAERVHRDLSGIHTFSIVLDSGIQDTFLHVRYLMELRKIQERLEAVEGFDRSFSFADFIALVNGVMDDTDGDPRQLPGSDELVREYMLFIKHRDVSDYVSADFGKARILVRHNIGSSERLNRVVAQLQTFFAEQVDPAFRVEITGESVLSNQAVDTMARGQFQALLLLAVVILLVVSLLFVNLKAGLVALVPNLFPVAVLFGVMGFFDIPLDAGTSMVAAIALGVCVDDTMHLMSRYHQQLKVHRDGDLALAHTLREEAVPIFTTSAALAAGFGVLATSSFIPVNHFGLLSALVILLALAATFVLTPLLLDTAELLTVWELLSLRVRDECLKRSPLFRGMNTWQIKKILLASEIREVTEGEYVMRSNLPGGEIFMVLDGEVELRRGHPDGSVRSLGTQTTGNIFGEEASLTGQSYSADAVARSPVSLLVLSWPRVRSLSRLLPLISLKLFRNLSVILGSGLSLARCQGDLLRDEVTGLYSKEFLIGRIEQEIRRAHRYDAPLSFMLIELSVIGGRGPERLHELPDALVQQVTDKVKSAIRDVDLLARWDGGRLAVLLPNTDLANARATAGRLVRLLETAYDLKGARLRAHIAVTRLDEADGGLPPGISTPPQTGI